MTTQNAIFDALQALITRIDAEQKIIAPAWDTLTAVIRSHQNGPRPQGAYAVLEFLSERDEPDHVCRTYRDVVTPAGPEPRAVVTATRSIAFLFEVEMYASNALDRLRAIRSGLMTPGAVIGFPFTVLEIGEVRLRPELVQQRWEGRAVMNLTIGARVATDALIDLIDKVPFAIEGRVASPDLIFTGAGTVPRP